MRMLDGIERAAAEVIEDATRGTDHDLRALLEGGDLTAHRSAAVDRDDLGAAELGELLELAPDLEGELARRRQDQRLDARLRALHQAVDDGEAERGRLSGAGAGLDDEALAARRGVEDGELDRRRVDVAERVDGLPDLTSQRDGIEGRSGRGLFVGCDGGGRLIHLG